MHMRAPSFMHRGFSLIELMVAVTIFMLLLMLAGPMYGEFMANSQIRNASEAILAGVRYAQAEAVRRNTPARFVLTADTKWEVWAMDQNANDTKLRTHVFQEGAKDAKMTPTGTTTITFNGLGRLMAANADLTAPPAQLDITNPNAATPRDLRVVVGAAGVKLCEPVITDVTDARKCP
jgi:type IV fimbrial biogenesis protein FimT